MSDEYIITVEDLAKMVLFGAASAGRTRIEKRTVGEVFRPFAESKMGDRNFPYSAIERAALADTAAIWGAVCALAEEQENPFGIPVTPSWAFTKSWGSVAGPTIQRALCFSRVILFFIQEGTQQPESL